MKFIRHIITGLALLSVLIVIAIVSIVKYPVNNINQNSTEDKIPVLQNILYMIDSAFFSDKNLTTDSQKNIEIDYTPKTAYSNDDLDKTDKKSYFLVNSLSDLWKKVKWSQIFYKTKESLFKDWSRP